MKNETKIKILKLHREHYQEFPIVEAIVIDDNKITFAHKRIIAGSISRQTKGAFINGLIALGYIVTSHNVEEKIHLRGKVTYFTFDIKINDLDKRITRPSMKILLGLI